MKRILIVAGGTGGHVFPALAVAEELIELGHDVRWVGTQRGIEANRVPNAGIVLDFIHIEGIRGKGLQGKLKAPLLIAKAVGQSLTLLKNYQPNTVLCFGGYVSAPVGLAAKLKGIPLLIHEQNAIAGTANKLLSKFSKVQLQAFSTAFIGGKTVGNPVRKALVDTRFEKGGSPHKPLQVLVLGGSLGAQKLNQTMVEVFDMLGDKISLWHQTGLAHEQETKALYGDRLSDENLRVVPFIEDMKAAYAFADLVICRSGAMTVSELAVMGKPAIFIPFPFAIDDHQTANAKSLSDQGAAILLPQTELTSDVLINYLDDFVQEPIKLEQMGQLALSEAKPRAAKEVAEYCLEVAI
ncbi:MAG: undecaprenyldiphospho-muramoylpentapeptide beta-N-acetylglucosaminyltransferase [Cellvibrionales bacterium]|nr:undecaprenyldiphospho-muramoylpentapeptide beta-N-acetylglucosaminyltransferase [Cellvibrionales bacterium]